jgi:hypothetical protein
MAPPAPRITCIVFDFKVERKKLPENLSKYNKLITVSGVIFKVISGR